MDQPPTGKWNLYLYLITQMPGGGLCKVGIYQASYVPVLILDLWSRPVFLVQFVIMTLSIDSQTLSPLPPVLSQGLVAVSTFGFLSFFFSTSLFLFLTYRLISWRRKSGSQAPTNQFLVLIYNLVLADIQQSIAFLLNVSSLRHNALEVGTGICWAQGWFVSTGDLASGVFIFAIALHTFMAVVRGYKLPSYQFYSAIVGCWVFVYAMAIVAVAMHPDDIYVRAGAWVCLRYPFIQYISKPEGVVNESQY